MIRALFASLALALAISVADADCYGERRGAGSGRYALKDGLAYDERTRLTWARCAIGQSWQGVGCAGEVRRLPFESARAAAAEAGAGWRLPSIQELASLIDPTCGRPATDRVAFPDIVENDEGKASYWSATASSEIPGMFYVVDFAGGDVDMHSTGLKLHVRLVRDGR